LAPNSARVPALMLQGTGSDVGKSLLCAGLCRAYRRRGIAVAPFKPQNMSNNAAVTADGGEIGRAQALQARAAGLAPTTDMNPVLLKPASDVGAQVVVQGKVMRNADARAYHILKPTLMAPVLESFERLSAGAELIVAEGAGSPAEVNLREGDIANMGFALAAEVPVVLVGDIDRGGVIAAITGTHALLEERERTLLKAYIVNKFRGDVSLFAGGAETITARTGLACLGIVPFFDGARHLPQEDAMSLDAHESAAGRAIKIAVPRLSRIANFDDLDPLAAEDDVTVEIVPAGKALPGDVDVILLPGTKATLADLAHLRAQGWDIDIAAHVRRGGAVIGLCGGYQMLGRTVHDPDGIEGKAGEAAGLGLLDVETVIGRAKTLAEVTGVEIATAAPVAGFEMHMGETTGPDRARPWLKLDGDRDEGAVSADGLVRGSYLHGIFAADAFRHAFLARFRPDREAGLDFGPRVAAALDALADHLETHLDLEALLEIARARGSG